MTTANSLQVNVPWNLWAEAYGSSEMEEAQEAPLFRRGFLGKEALLDNAQTAVSLLQVAIQGLEQVQWSVRGMDAQIQSAWNCLQEPGTVAHVDSLLLGQLEEIRSIIAQKKFRQQLLLEEKQAIAVQMAATEEEAPLWIFLKSALPETLGKKAKNSSGFQSLADVRVKDWRSARDTLLVVRWAALELEEQLFELQQSRYQFENKALKLLEDWPQEGTQEAPLIHESAENIRCMTQMLQQIFPVNPKRAS